MMPPPGQTEACTAQQTSLAGVVRHPILLLRVVLASGLAQISQCHPHRRHAVLASWRWLGELLVARLRPDLPGRLAVALARQLDLLLATIVQLYRVRRRPEARLVEGCDLVMRDI